MSKPFLSAPAVRRVCLLACAAITLLAGCGTLQTWYYRSMYKGPENPHSVTLSWDPSVSAVAGYNVYRASPPGKPGRLNLSLVPDNQYVDKTVEPGHTYSYYVTSVDSKRAESGPSTSVTVTVPTTVTPPEKN